jgi:predicted O-linked N-acetylglucosamine transferase (SPINDLY family)
MMNTNKPTQNIDALFQYATQLHQAGRVQEAINVYENIFQSHASHLGVKTILGSAYVQVGKNMEGIRLLKSSLAKDPKQYWAHNTLGVGLLNLKRYQEAFFSFNKAIAQKPDFIDTYFNLGKTLRAMHKYDEAIVNYSKCIGLNKLYADAYNNRGIIYLEDMKHYVDAVSDFKQFVTLEPDLFFGHYNLGNALKEMTCYDEALKSFDRATDINPDYAEAYNNRGIIFIELKRYNEALTSFDRATTINPDYAEAYYSRGIVFTALKRYDDALTSFDKAVAINPEYAEAYYSRGLVFIELKHYEHAVASFDSAITINPDYAEAFHALALSCKVLRRFVDALFYFDRAITLNPDYAEAHFNRGLIFTELRRLDEASASYDRAIALKPDIPYLLGSLLDTKMALCDWNGFDDLLEMLLEKVMHEEAVVNPFTALALIDNPAIHKHVAEIHAKGTHPTNKTLGYIPKYKAHDKIRIGYFSADFQEHPVSHLTAELFELHDRSQFEIFGFSSGFQKTDLMRKRLEIGFDQFIDVVHKTDQEVAMLAREMKIDIAVDLGGFTAESRVGIFAMRAAPIQVNYLGYPGTMSADYMDYIIADPILIPDEKKCHYAEKIAYLPETFMVNDSTLKPSEEPFSRKDFALPENAFIFACFNGSYKITQATFLGWMRILNAVDNSILWLSGMNQTAANNLKNKAVKCGISSDRIIFASRMPLVSDHLNRIKLADLFLDTFPYNAHTTSNDALRGGLPVLTLMGESFASRVAGSLLHAVNLPELITHTQEGYESLVIELATNPEKLKKIRSKLLSNLPDSALLNTKRFTRHIESAYQEMYQRYQDDLPPEHIYIKNSSKP